MIERVSEEQVQKFQDAARQFAKTHPDFNERLADAAKRGLDLATAQGAEIVRLCSPEAAYYLADPANEAEVRERFNVAKGEPVNDDRAADKIRRLVSSLRRHDVFTVIRARESDTDHYLQQRKAAIRRGDRRR